MRTKKTRRLHHKKKFSMHVTVAVLVLLVLVLPLTVFLAKQQQETRQYAASANVIYASNTSLMLNGQPTQFDGVNAYELATVWGENYGCGAMPGQNAMNSFFASLRPNSLVRFWARQGSMAINVNTHQLDWGPLDNVFNTAASYNVRLIVSIADQGGGCDDGHIKDTNWYNNANGQGYNTVYNSSGHTPYSFDQYASMVIQRYATSSAVGMWELINEPEAQECQTGYDSNGNCTSSLVCVESDGVAALKSFYDTEGVHLKSYDPNHLFEFGAIGSGQCGASYTHYQTIMSSNGLDVANYHDYGADTSPMPGDQWNGLQERLNEMKAIGKPLIVGEAGVKANDSVSGCTTLATRNTDILNKMNAQFPAGVAAYIPWDWVPGVSTTCDYDINPGDPLMTTLHDYTLLNNPSTPSTPTPTVNATVVALDTFQRANQTYWGTASDGQTWTGDASSNTVFSITNNAGQVTNTGSATYNAILGPNLTDSQVLFAGSLGLYSSSNIGAVVRWQDTNNWYKAHIDGTNLVLQKKVSGSLTTLATVAFTAIANTSYSLRFQAIGTTLSAKVWVTGQAEPSNWMLTTTDSTFSSGRTGLRMNTSSGTATYTYFTALNLSSSTPTSTPTPSPTPTPVLDTIPPTVTITSPLNGTTVNTSSTITISASATDNVGVTEVDFLANGTLLCRDTVAPYICNWTVPGTNNITYTITAQAYDGAGNASSQSVQVTAVKRKKISVSG